MSRSISKSILLLVISLLFIYLSSIPIVTGTTSSHTNNWAIIVSTSKYFFNYRHNADALTIYHTIKELGIPDSNIILMLPEDVACTPRNVIPAAVYNNPLKSTNLYDETSIEIDYKGDDVTVENFLRLLTHRHHQATPLGKRLLTDHSSNLFIYIAGHGGDQFMKFRDHEILTAYDLASSLHEMKIQNRFHNCFVMVDTCQASTLVELIQTPGIITLASSGRGENSYSHGSDSYLGLSLVDKFTYYFQQFYTKTKFNGSMYDLLTSFSPSLLHSSYVYRQELFGDTKTAPILDFLGATSSQVVSIAPIQYPHSTNHDHNHDSISPVGSTAIHGNVTLPFLLHTTPIDVKSPILSIITFMKSYIHSILTTISTSLHVSIWEAFSASIVILLCVTIVQSF